MSTKGAFTLAEVAMAAGVLLVVALPVAAMLSAGNRSTAMASEEIRAATLATEVLEAVETLGGTAYASQENPLPGTDQFRKRARYPGRRGFEETWADLDATLAEEGNGFPLDLRDVEASRLYLSPAPAGFRRYLKIEVAPGFRGAPEPLAARVRCLVRYPVATGGRVVEKSLELKTLVVTEDPLARLEP